MRVLVACEESQEVCKAFRALGHEAYSCDFVEPSGGHPEWHLQMDAREAIIQGWDLIIAHPPCTYLSNAGARWMYQGGKLNQERLAKMHEAREFFMEMLNAPCEHVCVENPISLHIANLPPYTQQIQPWQFGHPCTKATRLWLRGLPLLQPTNIVEPKQCYVQSSANRTWREGGRYKVASTTREREQKHSLELRKRWRNNGDKRRKDEN